MSKLWGLQSVWNGDETVFDSLKSLDKVCDNIIILENKWVGYEGSIRSTDNTISEIHRFIKEAKSKVELIQLTIELHQFEARNILVSKVPLNNYFLVLDSDEIIMKFPTKDRLQELINEWDKLNIKGLCIYSYDEVQGDYIGEGGLMDLPKIMKRVKELYMTENHRYYNIGSEPVIYNTKDFPACRDFCFMHKGAFKKTRKQAEDYKNWLINFEPHP